MSQVMTGRPGPAAAICQDRPRIVCAEVSGPGEHPARCVAAIRMIEGGRTFSPRRRMRERAQDVELDSRT